MVLRRKLAVVVLSLGVLPAGAPLAAPGGSPAARKPEAAKPAPASKKDTAAPKKGAAGAKQPAPAAKDVKAAPRPKTGAAQPGKGGGKADKPARKDASVAFFRDGVVPRLKIQIPEAELQRLREQNREYVRCTVIEDGGKQYDHVGIHLKGAAGSFRGLDDKPALTLNFDKFQKGQEFHDLDKIHLNNSVQDPSYLSELVCSELFLAAGVPAARTTHARVWLNGRDLGFYVLKEGFNKGFLKRHFANANGNLYEGGFVQDIDGDVKLQNGSGPTDRSDVRAVVEACREGDSAKRWQRLEKLVDIDQFLSFAAMELMTCHWDGYSNNRNNYRFYFEPQSGKLHFFPHGMDQMFGDTGASVLNVPGSMVASAVLSNPEWRGRYRDRLSELLKLFVPPDRLQKRVNAHHQRLRPVLAEMGDQHAREFDGQVKQLKERLEARSKSLVQQNAVVEPRPLSFTAAGIAPLPRWEPRQETPDAKLETKELQEAKGKVRSLAITTGPGGRCVASWRTKVIVPAGKYRLEARVRAEGIKALQESSGTGAGVRMSGSGRTNKLDGTAGWTLLSHEFQIQEPTREIELVAELRATAGQALFDAGSLRLVRVSP